MLIIHDAATYPGLVLRCTPIGIIKIMQRETGKKERNDRIFVVPERSPFEADLTDIRHLPKRATKELERFFEATNSLEKKGLEFLGWDGPEQSHRSHQTLLEVKRIARHVLLPVRTALDR